MAVVKQLREDGITSLFTNHFLQNMKRGFEKRRIHFLREIDKEPHARRHPLMILLGYLSFKVRKYDKSIEWFKKVLEEDANNINSILNLLYVYQQITLDPKVDYEKKLGDIVNGTLADKSKAYAKYELAEIMSAVDAYLQPGGFKKTRCLFDEATSCVNVPQDEKWEWLFGYAFFLFSVDSAYSETPSQQFEQPLKCFYQVVTAEQVSPSYNDGESVLQERFNDIIAKSWCFMGTLLSRHSRGVKENEELEQLKDVIECPRGFSDYTVKSCMEKAKAKATEGNAHVILRRSGLAYMDMGFMTEAKNDLEKAVTLDKENGYGHNLLGRWNLKKYKEDRNTTEREHLLNNAVEYFTIAIEKGFNKWHSFYVLAEAYFLKGEYINAIGPCQQSKEYGGNRECELYKLWAQIYDKLDTPDSAKKMRREAENLALRQYHDEHDFGVVYHDDDIDEIAPIVDDLENKLSVQCYFLNRDTLCGDNTVEAWGKLNKSCHYILVFCSENFSQGPSVAYRTLTSIIDDRCNSGDDSTILPVKLPGCTDIPPFLKSLRAIEADGSEKFIDEIRRKVKSYPLKGELD